MPPRSLRTACSQILASVGMASSAMVSNATPPAQSSVLWQSKQYCWTVFQLPCEASTGAAGVFAAIAAPQDMPQAAITAVIELRIENTRTLLNATDDNWDSPS